MFLRKWADEKLSRVVIWNESKKASITRLKADYISYVDSIKDSREKALKRDFRKWQIDVLEEFNAQYEHKYHVLKLPQELKDDLKYLLKNHYLRTSEALIGGIDFGEVKKVVEIPIDVAPRNENEVDFLMPQVLKDIEDSINDFIEVTFPEKLSSIEETTEKMGNLSKYLADRDDEIIFSVVLGRKLAGRETTISVTETNWIAEGSQTIALETTTAVVGIADKEQLKELQKISPNTTLMNTDIEELFLSESAYGISVWRDEIAHPQKEWITMGDRRVRETHQVLDGETISADQPFTLKGGKMMFPSDSSLGASFLEIVGCRCMAIYF